jgi:Bacteriocin-protection, YdeI or OmpD-Associated/Domain of unknown function (DUF1905)
MMVKFRTELVRGGGTTMGMVVPPEVVEALGQGKKPPVKVTINGYTYRNTIATMGGKYMIGVAHEHRKPAGVEDGGVVEVTLELDSEKREVEVPADLAAALAAAPGAAAAFEKLSYSHRREHARAITEAKAPETRARRIAKAVEMIVAGKKS